MATVRRPLHTPCRYRAIICAHYFFVILMCILCNDTSASAAGLDVNDQIIPQTGQDHNWHRIEAEDEVGLFTENYQQEVNSAESSDHQLLPRADTLIIDGNDSPNRGNITAGQTSMWKYSQALLTSPHAAWSATLLDNITAEYDGPDADAVRLELRRRDLNTHELSAGELEKRQMTLHTLFVSINVCTQPIYSGSGPHTDGPPQLTLYVGHSGNDNPGASSSGQQNIRRLDEGFASLTMQGSTDIYIAVSAPSLPDGYSGGWTYDLAVSVDNYYHNAITFAPFLYLVDTDTTSALLVTDNVTRADYTSTAGQKWMNMNAPFAFTIFANPEENTKRLGIMNSYCGLEQIADISSKNVNSADANKPFVNQRMIHRGLGDKPKQQFLVGNMAAGTGWNVNLAMPGNGTKSGKGVVGGGGAVWLTTSWTTKTDGNCQLVYDLDFCDQVAYAVPSNPKRLDANALGALYDNNTKALNVNFTYSLQQIACNTTNDAKYSLARNCDDCARAYKQWLCAVTIPRCEDFSNDAEYLYTRNVGQPFFQNNSMLSDEILNTPFQPMPGAPTLPGSPINQTWISAFATNQSRNPLIDQKIAPGPYKEVLPCEDLCYSLVQSCPASLQFGCPAQGRGLEAGYAPRPTSKSVIECSYLGAVYYLDGAGQLVPSFFMIAAFFLLALLW